MNRRKKIELDKLKNRDLDESLKKHVEEVATEALQQGKVIEKPKPSISTVRLRNLRNLVDKYDPNYRAINSLKPRDKDAFLEDMMAIYVPNVLNDIPGVLNRMETMNDYIKSLESLNYKLQDQNLKAYKYLKWTVHKYHDPAEALPDDPEELGDIDPMDIILNQKKKRGGIKHPKKKTKTKPKSNNKAKNS